MKIFSIYDSKAKAYLQPFFSPNHATAIRDFAEAVNEEKSNFHKHSGDYTLFAIATFDEHTGKITGNDRIDLGTANQYLETE